jgi:glycosyltransferase involved in cell wall biosynthesis
MKILLISSTYLPNTIAIAKMIYELSAELVKQGHQPVVFVPDPEIAQRVVITCSEGITVVRFRSGKIKNTSMLNRAFNEYILSYTAWRNAKSYLIANKCDLIVFCSPSIFWGNLVSKLKKLWNCRSYMVIRDIFPEWSVDAGLLKRGSLVHRLFTRKEMQQYAIADRIAVQSPANLDYFKKIDRDFTGKTEILYNWVDEHPPVIRHTVNYRNKYNLNNKVVFFYGGRFSPAQDIDNIVRLAESLQDYSNASFLLVGNGSEFDRIQNLVKNKKLSNIQVHPEVTQEEYLPLLSQFDVGLITLDKQLTTHNFPGKLLSYMQLSKPILASINPGNDLKQVVEEYSAGLVSINGDDEKLRENAVSLINNSELRKQLGNNANIMLKSLFSVKNACSRILQFASQNNVK